VFCVWGIIRKDDVLVVSALLYVVSSSIVLVVFIILFPISINLSGRCVLNYLCAQDGSDSHRVS